MNHAYFVRFHQKCGVTSSLRRFVREVSSLCQFVGWSSTMYSFSFKK